MSDTIQSLLDETLSLEHYGTKGMKWGQRNYQNPDGTYTELGKKRRRVGYEKEESTKDDDAVKIGGKAYKDMTRKERRAAKKRARHNEAERKAARAFNKEKSEAISSGNLDFITKNISRFSDDELSQAMDRWKRMETIRDMERTQKESKQIETERKFDKALRYLKRASDATDSLTNIYNKINQSSMNNTARKRANIDLENAKVNLNKSKHEYDKLVNPRKYDKNKTEVELMEEAVKLKKAQAELQKYTNDLERDTIDLKTKRNDLRTSDYNQIIKEMEAKKAVMDKDIKNIDKRIKEIDRDSKQYDWDHKDVEKQLQYLNNYYIQEQNRSKSWQEFWKADQEKWKAQNPNQANSNKKKNKNQDQDQDNDSTPAQISFTGSAKKDRSLVQKILGSDKLKDYESYKPSKNRSYSIDDLNKETQKAIKKIAKEKPKMGDYAQDKKWTKDMKKHDSYVIDQWVEDMKKKYMKERNMDAKAAEAKAEEYVDAWIDAYDEGKIKV